MTHTRIGAGTSQGGNDDDLPPPPPPPSTNEFFVQFLGSQRTMEETLCLIVPNTTRACSRMWGRSQINTVHSRTFWRLSLLSLKRQKNRSRLMSGWTLLNRSFVCWGLPKWWRPSMHRINCRGLQVAGGLIIRLPYLLLLMLPGNNSRKPLGGIIYPRGWCGWRPLSLWS